MLALPDVGGRGEVAAVWAPEADAEPSPEVAACRAAPTPGCLIDLAFAFAMGDEAPPAYSAAASYFAVLGEIGKAHAILVRSKRFHGASPEAAELAADERLASHHVAAAIRAGGSVEEAVAATPDVDAGAL